MEEEEEKTFGLERERFLPEKKAKQKPETAKEIKKIKDIPESKVYFQESKNKNPEKKVKYYQASKLSWKDFKKTIPKELYPTSKMNYVLGTVFVIVIIIGLLQFPLDSMMSGETDISIKIGLPWTFLEFDLGEPEKLPIKVGGFIADLILYLLISYIVDISINVFMTSSLSKSLTRSKKEKEALPRLHKIKKEVNFS